jgi:hypothetical protein
LLAEQLPRQRVDDHQQQYSKADELFIRLPRVVLMVKRINSLASYNTFSLGKQRAAAG